MMTALVRPGALIALLILAAEAFASDSAVVLRNERTLIGFAKVDAGFAVTRLSCLQPQRDFVAPGQVCSPLWRIALRPPSYDAKAEVAVDGTAPCALSCEEGRSGEAGSVVLRWRGIDLPGEPKALDVTVTVSLGRGQALSEWRIAVSNRSQKLGLWAVDFPLLPNLSVSKEGVLATPLGWGVVQTDPAHNADYAANYPGLFATMQVTSLADRGGCLYVSSHDPDGYVKQINWHKHPDKGCIEYFLRQYPEDMGKPGKSYESPYPVVIGCLTGDWYDAAKRYRQWVVAKTPWTPKVPLERFGGSPQWIKENPLWLQTNGCGTTEPTDSLLNCLDLRRAMPDVPVADQLYWWQKGWPGQTQFDEGYPDTFFDLGRGAVEVQGLKRVREAGVRMLPYTNTNLVDARTKYWKDGGWRWAALPPEQASRHEAWIADLNRQAAEGKPVNVAMCPYTKERGDIVVEWARKAVGEFGFNGVYLDQIACIDATMCFDPSHGHPLGGGKHWVQGYRQLLARVQKAIREIKPDAILTTESACEPFGYFDAYLRCNENQGWVTPIWSAVYGGLYSCYGGYLYEEDKFGGCLYAGKFAQLFTYGAQLGWLGLGPQVKERSDWLDYLHELARARYAAAKWMGMGEWLRPPDVQGAEKITGRWKLFASEYDVTWPAVLSGAFKAADGSVALAFTNFSGKEQQVTWTTRRADLGLAAGHCEARVLYPQGAAPAAVQQEGGQLSGTLTMRPLSAVVVVVSR
jgi:hypothetical protein